MTSITLMSRSVEVAGCCGIYTMLRDLKLMAGNSFVSIMEIHLLNIQGYNMKSYVYTATHKSHKHNIKNPNLPKFEGVNRTSGSFYFNAFPPRELAGLNSTLRPNGKQSDRTGECGQRRAHDTIEKLRSAPGSAQRRKSQLRRDLGGMASTSPIL